MGKDRHAPLRDDVRLLGDMLGQTLTGQVGDALFSTVEAVRRVAVEGRASGELDTAALGTLLESLDEQGLLLVARAFSQFLNLANLAEQQHRQRLWRQRSVDEQTDDLADGEDLDVLLQRLLANGHDADELHHALSQLSVELVLTAHPTEVTRRTLIRKYDRLAALLARRAREDLGEADRQDCLDAMRREILAAWCTDEIRRQRPTPVDEAKWGFATIEQSLWQAVPAAVRRLDRVSRMHLGKGFDSGFSPLKLASWMGGDRDGNPNVTAAVTREVLYLSRWMAADLYLRDVESLLADLSMQAANDALLSAAGEPEPYRVILRQVRERLRATRERMEALAAGREPDGQDWYECAAQLREPLLLLDRSLRDSNLTAVADGELRDTLVRLSAFGMTLLRLDIRQESGRHTDALSAITRYLDMGDYAHWDEARRVAFLTTELAGQRPLIDARFYASPLCSPEVQEVLDTCAVIAEQSAEAMGAYVISMAHQPSDVLAVYLLQREMGVAEPMRVVPLFETLDDLESATETMASLLAIDGYRSRVADGQEIMIGYSDSAKDAGFLGAAWAQFRAQESLTALFAEHGIALTLFHGRGGSVSRGGSPTRMALLSQPPGSVAGRIRVTEQGEVIRFKYGLPGVAQQNLELYLAATLEATVQPPAPPTAQWRDEMSRLTATSVQAYRTVVREDPALVRYLRTVTPEQELARLALGSRPARRRADGGVESLRAIPWVFAWTQIRLMLPAWLGTDAALHESLDDPQRADVLRRMEQEWAFFRGIVDMLEMVLAKADAGVAQFYEQRLTADNDLRELGQRLRQRLRETVSQVARLTGGNDLLVDNPTMKWSIQVRNPYTDPLHLIQAELMARLRQQPDDATLLDSALMVTIAGIAAGMRNTG